MRFLWILLLLPLADIFLSVSLYSHFGPPFLGWLLAGALAGLFLMGRARDNFRAALARMSRGDARMMSGSLLGFLASARIFVAGFLLLYPGVLTDVLALLVLFVPGRMVSARVMTSGIGPGAVPRAANDDVIEAEFHEVREAPRRLDEKELPPEP